MLTYRTEVEVEVNLGDFDNDCLVDELRTRGFVVSEWGIPDAGLTSEEIDLVANAFIDSKIGTAGYSIYDKLRKR